jgi:hypothetical protein
MEPGLETLFSLSMPLPGYADKAWAAARREAAAKAITSLVQRDHDARMQLMMTGGIQKLLALLDSKVGGTQQQQQSVYFGLGKQHASQQHCLPPSPSTHTHTTHTSRWAAQQLC